MAFLRQYLFVIPILVMVLCEVVKVLMERVRTGSWHEGLFKPGGMPSSHSAFVTSLLIVVGKKLGTTSAEFAIAFVFAAIVWYDAMSVRREVGLQAQVLNSLQHKKHLRERLGHSFAQVLAGIGFGAMITSVGIWLSYNV